MAIGMIRNAFLSVNGVDLSDHVKSISIKASADQLESTAMGATAKTRIPGLKDWTLDVEFNQDYDSGKVDATLFPLVGAAATAIIARYDSGVKGPTNPEFTGNALLPDYSPIDGSVGSLATTKVTFQGSGVLARATS